ncbi:putative heterokaryon incompatibility [Septoria linicola]|nr:putative heterokaryon incompatibility [Septoria linicola]
METKRAIYKNLDIDSRQIRVTSILPSSDLSAIVKCTLDVVPLGDEPDAGFEALSYCWGEPKITADIEVDGTLLAVTTNLEAALRQFRADANGDAVHIWIDAICIDQQDVEERNSQVAFMQDIYTKASNVRLWLGEDDERAEMVCSVLRRIINEPMGGKGIEELKAEEYNVEIRLVILALLFTYPYWERRWIVQEARSARHRTLHIGNNVVVLPSDVFSKIREYIRIQVLLTMSQALGKNRDRTIETHLDGLPKDSRIDSAATALDHLLQRPQTVLAELNSTTQWHKFLRTLKSSDCSVEHDVIYSILGLLPDKLGMQIDYKIPVVDLLCEFTWRWIQHWQNINLFYDVRNVDPALPSWVPELRPEKLRQSSLGPQAFGPNAISPDTLCESDFKAHGGVTKSELRRIDHYTIEIRSFLFDTVVAVGSEGPRDGSIMKDLTVKDAVEQKLPPDWLELYHSHCLAYPDEDPCDVILRTFHMNQDRHILPRGELSNPHVGGSERFRALFGLLGKSSSDGPFFTFFTTAGGRCGMCIPDIKVGDRVGVIARLWMPFCFRKAENGREGYKLLSTCYLHGVMDGEAVLSAVGGDKERVTDVFEHVRII